MKIGVCNSTLGSLGEIGERYAAMKKMGYTAIDLNMGEKWSVGQIYRNEACGFFDKSVSEIEEYFRKYTDVARENGIDVFQAHAPFPTARLGEDGMNAYTRMAIEKCIQALPALGCRNIVVHPICTDRHMSDEEAFELNFELFSAFIPTLKQNGTVMCIENAYHYYMGRILSISVSNAEFLSKLVDELNVTAKEECFGICYDTGHGNITGKNHYRELLVYGKRLKTLHIHDTDGVHDTHLIPYTGRYLDRHATDWEGILKALAKIGYDGCLSFESDSGIMAFPKEAQSAALQLNACIGKYFNERIEFYKTCN